MAILRYIRIFKKLKLDMLRRAKTWDLLEVASLGEWNVGIYCCKQSAPRMSSVTALYNELKMPIGDTFEPVTGIRNVQAVENSSKLVIDLRNLPW